MKFIYFLLLSIYSLPASAEFGIVKFYAEDRGFGYIKRLDKCNTKDVFVGRAAVDEAGLESLEELACVGFKRSETNGKTKAIGIELVDPELCAEAREHFESYRYGSVRRPAPDFPGCRSRL